MDFTYTGDCQVLDDNDNNWRIKFLSSGTLVLTNNITIDVFLVGGGGAGGYALTGNTASAGGGGYTKTEKSLVLNTNIEYSIIVGAGGTEESNGGDTSAFNVIAGGGNHGQYTKTAGVKGGDGGSGGGAAWAGSSNAPGNGGSDGSDGGSSGAASGGTGQGTTTREFGEPTGDLYAGGGGGLYGMSSIGTGGAGGGGDGGKNGTPNTGGGGGGNNSKTGSVKTSGGSGIVIIRNHRE